MAFFRLLISLSELMPVCFLISIGALEDNICASPIANPQLATIP